MLRRVCQTVTRYAQRLQALQVRLDAAGGLPAVVSVEVPYGANDALKDALIEAAFVQEGLDRTAAAPQGVMIVLLTDFGGG